VNVAFIYPKTGGLAAFGQEEFDGFQAGLDYTKGKCGGYTINPTYIDDATDPATAINAFKNEVGQGVKIIAGTGSSGIALQLGPLAAQNNVLYIAGAAAADAITGLNRNTFRAGRQTLRVAPYHLSETPPTIRTPAPKLGEHTESVLAELTADRTLPT